MALLSQVVSISPSALASDGRPVQQSDVLSRAVSVTQTSAMVVACAVEANCCRQRFALLCTANRTLKATICTIAISKGEEEDCGETEM